MDDTIPFNEYFVIAYAGWYVLIVVSLGYFLLYNVENFKNLQTYIIITQIVAMAVYILYPTRQDLRPTEFPRENVFSWLMGVIYAFDTSTGVCPSLHVAYSLGIASTWMKEESASKTVKAFILFAVFMICISVSFVKQHSVVDIFAALPLGVLAEVLVFRKYYAQKRRNRIKS